MFLNIRSKSEDSFVDFDQEELEFLIDESNHNWAFRLVDYLCDSKHCLAGLLNDFAGFDLVDRINLLKVLKVKLAKSHRTKEQRSELALDVDYVDIFICLYIKASAFFKGLIDWRFHKYNPYFRTWPKFKKIIRKSMNF